MLWIDSYTINFSMSACVTPMPRLYHGRTIAIDSTLSAEKTHRNTGKTPAHGTGAPTDRRV